MSNDLVHYFVSYWIPLNGNGIQFFHKDITMKCKYITYYGNCICLFIFRNVFGRKNRFLLTLVPAWPLLFVFITKSSESAFAWK